MAVGVFLSRNERDILHKSAMPGYTTWPRVQRLAIEQHETNRTK